MKTGKVAVTEQAQEVVPAPSAAASAQNGSAHGLNHSNKPTVEHSQPIGKLNGKVNILLVDDRKDKLLALGAVLSPLGQNIVEAHSGKEALRLLLKNEFAVILMDVSMPTMDGFETAALIRKRPASEHTPIIFVTSIGNSPTQMYQGYSLGAVDYILTPIVPEVLRAKVGVFVELWRKTEHIKQQAERLREVEETEHRRQLAEAVDRLEAETKRNRFFTLALDMLGIGDFDGHLLQVNAAWENVLGYTEDELRGALPAKLVHPQDLPMIYERVQLLKQGLPVEYFELRCLHKDGSYRWIGWTAARGGGGPVVALPLSFPPPPFPTSAATTPRATSAATRPACTRRWRVCRGERRLEGISGLGRVTDEATPEANRPGLRRR